MIKTIFVILSLISLQAYAACDLSSWSDDKLKSQTLESFFRSKESVRQFYMIHQDTITISTNQFGDKSVNFRYITPECGDNLNTHSTVFKCINNKLLLTMNLMFECNSESVSPPQYIELL